MTTTDLVYSGASLEERKGYAAAIARAGDLLPKSLWETVMIDGRPVQRPSAGKVLLIAETGNMLGVHPIAALNGVNVIEGKPTVSPALMRALIQRAGHKVRVRETGTIEGGDYAVTVEIVRSDDADHPYTSTWTPHRAARAGLCKYERDDKAGVWRVIARSRNGNPLPWEAYTESLCLARATREVANQGASDVIMGVYTPEELGGHVDGEGNLVDVTATAIDRTPSPAPAAQAEAEPIEAEVVEEQPSTPEPAAATTPEQTDATPVYDQTEADEWAAQISDAKVLGNPKDRGAIDADTLAGVWLRAQRAGVLEHLVDDPTRIESPITIGQYIEQRQTDLRGAA